MFRRLSVSESHGIVGSEMLRLRLIEDIILRLNDLYDKWESAMGNPYSRDDVVVPIIGGSGGLVVSNSIGAVPGMFVSVSNGVATLADYDSNAATHCVGVVGSGTMTVFSSWASGPVRVFGDGSGRECWLGKSGRATLTAPTATPLGTRRMQILATLLRPVYVGTVPGQLTIDNFPNLV